MVLSTRRDLGLENLEGVLMVVPEVHGETDVCHAAFAELALDFVAAYEGPVEAVDRVGHGCWLRGRPDRTTIIILGAHAEMRISDEGTQTHVPEGITEVGRAHQPICP
jgi:hypothetical protein